MFERTQNVFTQIGHFTRRMHNKAMIADNQIAIVGGRNLGDEYFSASPTLQFRDLDVLAAGPITADVSASFDDYWNSSARVSAARAEQAEVRSPRNSTRRATTCAQHWRTNADPYNAKPLNATPLASRSRSEQLGLVWAPTEFKADSPEKIEHPSPDYKSPPMQRLGELMQGRAAANS